MTQPFNVKFRLNETFQTLNIKRLEIIMVKKAASHKEEPELSVKSAGLPVTESDAVTQPVTENEITPPPVIESDTKTLPDTESETAALPVTEAKIEVPSKEADKEHQTVEILSLKIAELEDKLVHLELELSGHLNKKKNKKERKGKKVKCKCKDKTVDAAKCKCETKKLDK